MSHAPPKVRAKKSTRRALLLLLLLGALVLGILKVQRLMLFPRYATLQDLSAAEAIDGLERIWIESEEGPVEAFFIPGEGVSADAPGPVVLFAHGNGELIDHWPEAMRGYRRMGLSVLLPEYRGYGRSAGSPSQAAITEDLLAFHDLLLERSDVDRSRIVYHGRSLGGGAVCALAALREPKAMILMSTFTSVREMAQRYLLPAFLVLDPFENEAVVRGLDAPLLLVHGTRDRLIPIRHAERLSESAGGARLIRYEADHNRCPPDWERYFRDVRDFFEEHQILGTSR
ncbi:MAG: alpha/beta hydrolase [Myxococcales bacterium]|nr:alpha/beta hydrolase [Myxococcales bacterium]